VFSRRGVEAARTVARRHRGTEFDPAVVDLFSAATLFATQQGLMGSFEPDGKRG
jgi:hypothetical protein